MNILVVEDDNKQRQALLNLINKNFLDVRNYESNSVKAALNIIEEKDIDLFFLDIRLIDGSGLDLAEKIRRIKKYELTPIIFITTERNQIMNAFKKIHCYDFLDKPFNNEDVKNIIELFFSHQGTIENSKYTFVKLDKEISIKVFHNDILFIEYSLRKCKIHTTKGTYTVKSTSLSKLLTLLDNEYIVQTHKSYAVNLKRINRLEPSNYKSWYICFENYEERAILGYRFKNQVPLGN